MSKKQKRILIRTAVRFSILAVLVSLTIHQYTLIGEIKNENRALLELVLAIEKKTVETEPVVLEVETEPKTEDEAFIYIGDFKITGYDPKCAHCCGKSDGITASMTNATVGKTVAMNKADMRKYGIEYGDTIIIDGLGERTVEDTGCGEGVIDVVCGSHSECYKITGNYRVLA